MGQDERASDIFRMCKCYEKSPIVNLTDLSDKLP